MKLVEKFTGRKQQMIEEPKTRPQSHRNVTVALMAILNIFGGLDLDLTADGKNEIKLSYL